MHITFYQPPLISRQIRPDINRHMPKPSPLQEIKKVWQFLHVMLCKAHQVDWALKTTTTSTNHLLRYLLPRGQESEVFWKQEYLLQQTNTLQRLSGQRTKAGNWDWFFTPCPPNRLNQGESKQESDVPWKNVCHWSPGQSRLYTCPVSVMLNWVIPFL